MADSIILDNTNRLKGLMNPSPHALVPVESLTRSPLSSTGSASVLEWNSNSDSELFHLSSPPRSAPALTAQPTSPSLSPFSTSPSSSPAPAPSSSADAPLAESAITMHWPELQYEDARGIEATPVPSTNVAVAVADDEPALILRPEELDPQERRYLDLRTIVNKWQFETSNAVAAEQAPDAPTVFTEVEEDGSPMAAEDTSMTSTIVQGVQRLTTESPSAAPVPISPPTTTAADDDQADGDKDEGAVPPFDSSSPYSAAVSLISIAEYFRRKAETEGLPSVDDVLGTSTTAQQVVSPRSAVTYFSPPASTTGEEHNTAFDRVFGYRPERLRSVSTTSQAGTQLVAVSEDGYPSAQPPNAVKNAGASVSELVASGLYSPYSASTERESKTQSPIFATAFELLRNGGNVPAPLEEASGASIPPRCAANDAKPQAAANTLSSQGTTLGPQMYIARPIWSPSHPELEFRQALRGNFESPILPNVRPTVYGWGDRPISIPADPVVRRDAPRKPRPPLPTPPSVKRQMAAAATPQFTLRGELAKPHEYIPASFAQAVPSCWTGRLSVRSPLLSPSPRSSSPALTAHPSDVSVPHSLGPRQSRSPSLVDSPPPPRRRRSPPPRHAQNQAARPMSPASPQPTLRRASRSRSRSDRVPSPDEWLPLVYPSDDDASDSGAQPIPPAPAPAPAPVPARAISPPWSGYVPSPVPSSRASLHHQRPAGNGNWAHPSFPWHGTGGSWGNGFTPRRLRFATPDTPSPGRTPPPVPPPMMGAPFGLGPQAVHAPSGWVGLEGFAHSSPPPTPVVPPAAALNISANAPWFTPEWKYSFGDATLILRVETHLYRIHRHFFERHSEYFRKMLASYYFTESSHVFLPEVKKVDFEHLLSIFYPDDLTKQSITTLAGWSSVLALAQKWDMHQVRTLAMKQIGEHPQASAMDKVILAHKHSLRDPAPAWLLPALKTVCARPTPVALADAEQLDMPTVVKLWEVQCEVRAAHVSVGYGNWLDDAQVERLVKAKFGPFAGSGAGAGSGMGMGTSAGSGGAQGAGPAAVHVGSSAGRSSGHSNLWGSALGPPPLGPPPPPPPPPPMPMPMRNMGPYAYPPPGPYPDMWSGHRRT